MKKKIWLLTIILLVGSLYANDSLYVGINTGGNIMSGNRNDTVNAGTPTPFDVHLASQKSMSNKNILGGIFAGYLFKSGNFAIGPEFFTSFTNLEHTVSGVHIVTGSSTSNFDVKYKITTQAGINARIGYCLEKYFIYTMIGVFLQKTNYEVKVQKDIGAGVLPQHYYSKGAYIGGPSFGLGVQKPINDHYFLGLEFKTTIFPKKSMNFNVGDDENSKLYSRFKFNLYTINLRLIYLF
jgi:hypothetical protein